MTLVPVEVYFKRGKVKVTLGIGRGKKLHDKREDIAKGMPKDKLKKD